MRQSVLFEACVLSVFGIFLGVLSGLLGIGITLHCVNGLFQRLLTSGDAVDLSLAVTWQSILIAAAIGFITVLISALIPAARAVKLSPIQAIRQNVDVRIRPGEVKTSGISYRLFGFEAMDNCSQVKQTGYSNYTRTQIDLPLEYIDPDYLGYHVSELFGKSWSECRKICKSGK